MKLLKVAGPALVVLVLAFGCVAWPFLRPSDIVIRNAGQTSLQLTLEDADHVSQVWSGDMGPGRSTTVRVWFKHEGAPKLTCVSERTTATHQLDYVTGHMPMSAEVRLADCGIVGRTSR